MQSHGMTRLLTIVCAAVVAIFATRLWPQTTAPSTPVKASYSHLYEHRHLALDPSDEDPMSTELSLQVTLSGEILRQAAAFTNLHVLEALDDRGTSLVDRQANIRMASELHVIGKNDTAELATNPSVRFMLRLATPPRAAKKVIRIKSQLQIRTVGKSERTIRIATARKWLEKGAIQDASLAKANLSVQISNGANGYISVRPDGDTSAVKRMQLIDAENGAVLAEGQLEQFDKSIGLKPTRPFDDKMDLLIHISVDQKVITIPFELKDVPLP